MIGVDLRRGEPERRSARRAAATRCTRSSLLPAVSRGRYYRSAQVGTGRRPRTGSAPCASSARISTRGAPARCARPRWSHPRPGCHADHRCTGAVGSPATRRRPPVLTRPRRSRWFRSTIENAVSCASAPRDLAGRCCHRELRAAQRVVACARPETPRGRPRYRPRLAARVAETRMRAGPALHGARRFSYCGSLEVMPFASMSFSMVLSDASIAPWTSGCGSR